MKLDSTNPAISNLTGKKCEVELSPILFQMFTDMIYENKIGAVVREVISNAVDSHNAAGTQDTPIRVTLPNYGNPIFSVEDFGLGMDRETFESVYSVLTRSPKRESGMKNQIGGFGVGAQSPYAYTETFQVTIRKDGIESCFVCFKDKENIPSYRELYTMPTEQRNGVKVEVAVNGDDFRRFEKEAAFFLSFFDHELEILGTDSSFELVYPQARQALQKDGYAFSPKVQDRPRTLVIVGGVPYPLTFEDVGLSLQDERLTALAQMIRQNTDFMFKMDDIDDVTVALSREALSLTPETTRAIQEKIARVSKKILSNYQKELDSIGTIRELSAWANRVRHIMGSDHFLGALVWKGKSLYTRSREVINFGKLMDGGYRVPRWKRGPSPAQGVMFKLDSRADIRVIYRDSSKDPKVCRSHVRAFTKMSGSEISVFFLSDPVSRTRKARLQYLLGEQTQFIHINEVLDTLVKERAILNDPREKRTRSGKRSSGTGNPDHVVLAKRVEFFNIVQMDREIFMVPNDLSAYDRKSTVLVSARDLDYIASSKIKLLLLAQGKIDRVVVFQEDGNNFRKLKRNGVMDCAEWLSNIPEEVLQEGKARASEYNRKKAILESFQFVGSISKLIEKEKCPVLSPMLNALRGEVVDLINADRPVISRIRSLAGIWSNGNERELVQEEFSRVWSAIEEMYPLLIILPSHTLEEPIREYIRLKIDQRNRKMEQEQQEDYLRVA